MDPKAFGDWLSGEIAVATHVSFWVVVAVLGLFIWRAMEWRYRAIIDGYSERLNFRDEKLVYLEQRQQQERIEQEAAVSDTPPEEVEKVEERVFVPESVTPDYLRNIFSENTSLQAEKLASAFMGRWIEVTGQVVNVLSGLGGGANVSIMKEGAELGSREGLRNIYLHIPKGADRAAMLRRGDVVKAQGRIHDIGAYDVTLDPAELI